MYSREQSPRRSTQRNCVHIPSFASPDRILRTPMAAQPIDIDTPASISFRTAQEEDLESYFRVYLKSENVANHMAALMGNPIDEEDPTEATVDMDQGGPSKEHTRSYTEKNNGEQTESSEPTEIHLQVIEIYNKFSKIPQTVQEQVS